MAKVYWVLNIDLKGSSDWQTSERNREKVSRVLENTFRFFTSNAGLDPDLVAWAGDGGFAAFENGDNFSAEDVFGVAKAFARHVGDFVNRGYLELDFAINPTYRITIGRVTAAPSSRLSNLSGPLLNILLKYERLFGKPGNISIWSNVYESLSEESKKLFSQRSSKDFKKLKPSLPDEVRNVFDYPFAHQGNVNPELMNLVLFAKEEIDQQTIHWMVKTFASPNTKNNLSLSQIINEVFTPEEMRIELLKKIHRIFSTKWSGKTFGISYARPISETEMQFQFSTHECGAQNRGISVKRDDPTTGAIAWRTLKPKFISSTRTELSKPEGEREFSLLYPEEDTSKIASLACFPVVSRANNENLFHGVVSVTIDEDGFFNQNLMESMIKAMNLLLTELSIAELFDTLIQKFPQEG